MILAYFGRLLFGGGGTQDNPFGVLSEISNVPDGVFSEILSTGLSVQSTIYDRDKMGVISEIFENGEGALSTIIPSFAVDAIVGDTGEGAISEITTEGQGVNTEL